ncbi:MAG: hypothetical protein R3C05_19565 [Pirellulaceae bacterium]
MKLEDQHVEVEASNQPQARRERLLLVGIGIALLSMAAHSYIDLDPYWVKRFASGAYSLLFAVGQYTLYQGLVIWLALRYPILGHRPVVAGTAIIGLLLTSAYLDYRTFVSQFPILEDAWRYQVFGYALLGRFNTLIVPVVGFVLLRKHSGIHMLIGTEEPPDRPGRLSIADIMLWTFVVATYFAMRKQYQQFVALSDLMNDVGGGWISILSVLLFACLPVAGFWILIRFPRVAIWKRIVGLFALVASVKLAETICLYFALGIPLANLMILELWSPLLMNTITTASAIILATWFLQQFGFRFVQTGGDEHSNATVLYPFTTCSRE